MSAPDLTLREAHDDRSADAVLNDKLWRHNVERCGDGQRQELRVLFEDADGVVRAGLLGDTFWGFLYVDVLFVDEELRGQGLGSRLLARAEELARERGCHSVQLDTFSWSYPSFYERHGYETYGTLEGYPGGHRRFFYRKSLNGTPASR